MPDRTAPGRLAAIVEAFRGQLAARGEAGDPRCFETHISLVLLAGACAYKFKKAVDFGFVDFSTLARRRHFCAREVALNARFAPGLYLGVEAVRTAPGGAVEEYAVRMRRFDPADTLDHLLARGAVDAGAIAEFAERLADLHAALAPTTAVECGTAALAARQIQDSAGPPLAALLPGDFTTLLAGQVAAATAELAARHAGGHVRDCHGDLHLANVVRIDGRLLPFDCIEFNDELSSIDTLSDAAFLLMDLDMHGAAGLGHVFFNHYLGRSGDYAGLRVLRLYLAYRALVRGKVALLSTAAPNAADARAHAALARRYLDPAGRPGLLITHGLSGSGKTHHARAWAEHAGFVHLRSDVERKRLAGLPAHAASASAPGGGLYTAAHDGATYDQLHACADAALAGGFSVVVDATFLKRAERARYAALAARHDAPFHILHCDAPLPELRARVAARGARGEDASEATVEVLERQCRDQQPLSASEQAAALTTEALTRIAASGDHPQQLGRARAH